MVCRLDRERCGGVRGVVGKETLHAVCEMSAVGANGIQIIGGEHVWEVKGEDVGLDKLGKDRGVEARRGFGRRGGEPMAVGRGRG